MKILILGAALCLFLSVRTRNISPPAENLEELYNNATSWTWTHNRKTGERVKRQANCYTRMMDFSNEKTNPGWDLQTTDNNQHPSSEGWTMISRPDKNNG